MPMLLFLFCITLILVFQKQTRKYFLSFIIIFPLIFFTILNSNSVVKSNFKNFYGQISNMVILVVSRDFNNNNSPQYLKEFSTFYDTWLLNKYIGGGIKSFRYYCHMRKNIEKNSTFICNMHPHNYYLEILTETGIIGLVIITSFFLGVLYISFFKKYFTRSLLNNNNHIIPFIFLFIVEIFPLKSTGSFFTTGNTTYFFLILAILIGLTRKDNSIEN
jgi:O-antigen ligase